MNDTFNPFGQLDAQSAESSFAQFTPQEHAEYQNYLDEMAQQAQQNDKLMALATFLGQQVARLNALLAPRTMPPDAIDHAPDPLYDAEAYERDIRAAQGDEPDAHLDAAFEERTEMPDEPQGWPGDGSGVDDFADMNANEADDYRDE